MKSLNKILSELPILPQTPFHVEQGCITVVCHTPSDALFAFNLLRSKGLTTIKRRGQIIHTSQANDGSF